VSEQVRRKLKAAMQENARLKAEVERVVGENSHLQGGIYSLSLNVVQLKDEVERLTKAGDELGEWFMDIHPSKKKWNAAKGVQS